MEAWTLHHPEHGVIEVQRGFDAEFLLYYPDWPEIPPLDKNGILQDFVEPPSSAGIKERVLARVKNPPARLHITVDGEPVRRFSAVENGRYPLNKHLSSKLTVRSNTNVSADEPHLRLLVGALGDLLQIDYRQGSEVVEFDPPAGTRAAQRHEAMEASRTKRFTYPILAGLGKSGWALAVLVFGPVVARFFDWVLGFLPEWQLPKWRFPQIVLPRPELPQIILPRVPWPEWNLPQFEIPGWMEFLLDYTKVWVPVVVGVVFAVMAVRNHRKSEEKKKQWEASNKAGS